MFNIWMIDDDIELCSEFIKYWEKLSADYPFRFQLFSTAKEALEALWSPELTRKKAPDVIIVDGYLQRDQKDLNDGVVVIQEIVAKGGDKAPILIAFSGNPLAEEDMVRAGAHASFGKIRWREVIRYIQKRYDKLPPSYGI